MLNKGGRLFSTGNTSGVGGAYQLAPAAILVLKYYI